MKTSFGGGGLTRRYRAVCSDVRTTTWFLCLNGPAVEGPAHVGAEGEAVSRRQRRLGLLDPEPETDVLNVAFKPLNYTAVLRGHPVDKPA